MFPKDFFNLVLNEPFWGYSGPFFFYSPRSLTPAQQLPGKIHLYETKEFK